jgi:hypothetical protein
MVRSDVVHTGVVHARRAGEDADLTCTSELKMMPLGTGRRICPGLAPAMLYLEYFVANRSGERWEALTVYGVLVYHLP